MTESSYFIKHQFHLVSVKEHLYWGGERPRIEKASCTPSPDEHIASNVTVTLK